VSTFPTLCEAQCHKTVGITSLVSKLGSLQTVVDIIKRNKLLQVCIIVHLSVSLDLTAFDKFQMLIHFGY